MYHKRLAPGFSLDRNLACARRMHFCGTLRHDRGILPAYAVRLRLESQGEIQGFQKW
jgi:hypothetical protein